MLGGLIMNCSACRHTDSKSDQSNCVTLLDNCIVAKYVPAVYQLMYATYVSSALV
jgi:hypothetical protein